MQQLFHRLGDIDHVIWDWNGTLLNDVPHAVDTINFLLGPRGLPLMSIERYREIFSFPIRRYYETLGFDLQAESFADLCDQFIDRFMAKVGECALAPGAASFGANQDFRQEAVRALRDASRATCMT